MAQYALAPGVGVATHLKAKDVVDLIRKLEDATGAVQAEQLVQASKAKGALLHECFEWNDSKAGHRYRLNQAGGIITRVREIDDAGRPNPVYVHVRREKHARGIYKRPERLSKDEYRLAVVRIKQRIRSLARLGSMIYRMASAKKDTNLVQVTELLRVLETSEELVARL